MNAYNPNMKPGSGDPRPCVVCGNAMEILLGLCVSCMKDAYNHEIEAARRATSLAIPSATVEDRP